MNKVCTILRSRIPQPTSCGMQVAEQLINLQILFWSRIPQSWYWSFIFFLPSSDGLYYLSAIINMIVLIYDFYLFYCCNSLCCAIFTSRFYLATPVVITAVSGWLPGCCLAFWIDYYAYCIIQFLTSGINIQKTTHGDIQNPQNH